MEILNYIGIKIGPFSIGNFTLGPWLVGFYGIAIVFGVTIACMLGSCIVKMQKLNIYDFIVCVAMSGLGIIIGAKLLYFITIWDEIDFSRFSEAAYRNMFINGGFVYYGGFFGWLAIIPIVRYALKIDIWTYIENCFPCAVVAHGFGRIGCFLGGCCYGIEYDGPFAMTYYGSLAAPDGVSLFPVQMLESLCLFALAGFLFWYRFKHKGKQRILVMYAFTYAPLRFLLEFLRGDSARGRLLFFSTSQWCSIVILLVAVIFVIVSSKKDVDGK